MSDNIIYKKLDRSPFVGEAVSRHKKKGAFSRIKDGITAALSKIKCGNKKDELPEFDYEMIALTKSKT